MKRISRLVLLLIVIQYATTASAQQYFFRDASENSFRRAGQKRQIIPEKYRTVALDTMPMLTFLRNLPRESEVVSRQMAPIISLPMPNGQIGRFRIWETPFGAPELMQQLPNMKTFTGQGIDDPTAMLKADWTEFGFHAMVLSDVTGNWFIDPYEVTSREHYISYFKADFKKADSYHELEPINYRKIKSPARPEAIQAGVCIGTHLRTYSLAVACTGEYAVAATGVASPTVAQAQAKIVTSVNRVSGVYEKELSIRLELIANNSTIVYVTAASDPFTGNNNAVTLINESQTVIDANIGSANYDIGHTFSTGGGGLAGLGVVCRAGQKARGITGSSSPVGDPYDIDYVAHEMGHQFGAEHTFNSLQNFCNGNGSSNANSEPGSGSTIMAYAGICSPENLQNNSDPYFNAISFDQITDYVITSGTGGACASSTVTGNQVPVVNAGADYSVPLNTPFVLTGSATDGNGDVLTYCWEETDFGGPFGSPTAPSGDAPVFRSFNPVTVPYRYFPKLSDVINNTSTIGEILPSYARTMHFRLTARDNRAGGGGVCRDEMTVTTVAGTGPFLVTYPTAAGISWTAGDFQTVTWDKANTNFAPISCANVKIELSVDGGLTYPTVLLASTPNTGSAEIVVPNVSTTTARIRVIALGNVFYDISNNNFAITASASTTFTFSSPAPVQVCSAASGTATLSTASLNGFTTAISLSASQVPAGASISFGTNPVTPGNSTTVTLNNAGSLAAGSYTVRITGIAGAVTKTRDIIFVTGSGPAAPSSLTAPANDATGVITKPSFTWSTVADAQYYTLEISTAYNFSTIVQSIPNITTLPYTLTTALAENTLYYYRVKSVNACGTGPVSVVNRFRTGLNSCRISNDVPKAIPSTGINTITSTLTIPAGLGVTITDLNVVGLDILHTYIADLVVTLTSPAGTTVTLFNTICGEEDNIFVNLDDQAATAVFPCPPVGGVTVQPQSALSAFNGQSSTGIWTLSVSDNYEQDGGTLNGWGLSINTNSTTCSYTATPLVTTYTFTGNGNWTVASNWSGNTVPPNPLPAGAEIVINHAAGGNCQLNISQTISTGGSIKVLTGKNLLVQGNLNIQ